MLWGFLLPLFFFFLIDIWPIASSCQSHFFLLSNKVYPAFPFSRNTFWKKKITTQFEWKYLWTNCLFFIIRSKGWNYWPHFKLSWGYFGEKQFGLQVHCMTKMLVSLAEFVGRYSPLSLNVKYILNESVKLFWCIFIIYIHAGPPKLKLVNIIVYVHEHVFEKRSMPWTVDIFLNPNAAFLWVTNSTFHLLTPNMEPKFSKNLNVVWISWVRPVLILAAFEVNSYPF